jgi:tetratricopeptide (TPR) repeat protein/DNA-binding response OmpR family regulator
MDKLKVLVVARLDDMGGFISKILNRQGFDVNVLDTFRQVKETLSEIPAELSQRKYDLVLLTNNCLTPGMILNLVPEIKRSNSGIKIIVLSGVSTPEFVRDLKKQGIDDFLPMPFAHDDLVQKVTSIFDEPEEEKPHPIPHNQRDFIGKDFEVYDVLGAGGFGVVYLVYSHETKSVYALKTFRDEYLEDTQTRDRFRKEAKVWIDLERHPYIVRAYFVNEISGRLYIGLEYIAKDEHGLNSLEGYLRDNPPDSAQSLRWGIQFCHGMEYAYSKGIRAHRDIKPVNIMVSQDKTIKISDFGLAGVIGTSKAISGMKLGIQKDRIGLSFQTMEGIGLGTLTHMPPEQFTNAASCDERSDIYSFGIVLYQMATSGKLPFLAQLPRDNSEEESKRFETQMYMLHSKAPLPKVNSPLFPVTQRCLEKESHRRYRSFKELRLDLEKLLKRETGEVLNPPELKKLEAWEWNNKGVSLANLGRYDEALTCCNKVLEIDQRDAEAWNNKGVSLANLGRSDEALTCYNKALEIDQRDAKAWSNKGKSLHNLGRYDEALTCCNKALEIDPRLAEVWNNKGSSLATLGRFDEAILCYNKVLEIDPRDTRVWSNKGLCLFNLGRFDEAIPCYNKVLEIDPRDTISWNNKGFSLYNLRRYNQAIPCYNKALEIDPRDAIAWNNKGNSLYNLGRFDEAILCYNKALEIDLRDARVWNIKGLCLHNLGRFDEALTCCNKALEIDPRYAKAWYNNGFSLAQLGRYEEAIFCFNKVLEIDQGDAVTWLKKALTEKEIHRKEDAIHSFQKFIEHAQGSSLVDYARQELRELEK